MDINAALYSSAAVSTAGALEQSGKLLSIPYVVCFAGSSHDGDAPLYTISTDHNGGMLSVSVVFVLYCFLRLGWAQDRSQQSVIKSAISYRVVQRTCVLYGAPVWDKLITVRGGWDSPQRRGNNHECIL